MSELYRTSETSDAAPAADTPAPADAGSDQYEQPAQADDLTRYEGTLEGDEYSGYDDGGTLAAEEDGLPTRQEAWEQTWGDSPEHHDENDLAAYYDGDTSTLAAEEEGLPTRQEAWEQTWDDSPEYYDENELATGYDGDTSTLAAEEQGLPTRQEAWQQAWGGTVTEQYTDTQSTIDAPDSEGDRSVQEPSEVEEPGTAIAEPAGADAERAPSEQVTVHDQYGHDVPITVIHATAEDHTLGDDAPTGTGLKPTGEELLSMEGDETAESRKDRYFRDLFEHADDVKDASENTTQAIEAFRYHDDGAGVPTSAHAGYAVFERPPEDSHVQDIVGGVAMTSVAAVVGIRHWWTERKKEHTRQ